MSGPKNVNIYIPKEDYRVISFFIDKNGKKIKLDDGDSIAMTVRKLDSDNDSYEIRKVLGDGISYNTKSKNYEIEINKDDTKNMVIGACYGYDITIFYSGTKPVQKAIGRFTLGEKYSKFSILVVEE